MLTAAALSVAAMVVSLMIVAEGPLSWMTPGEEDITKWDPLERKTPLFFREQRGFWLVQLDTSLSLVLPPSDTTSEPGRLVPSLPLALTSLACKRARIPI